MVTVEELEEMEKVDVRTVDKETLVDISGLIFDNTIPQEQRLAWILDKVKNPYCFRVGDMAIKLEFADDGPRLQDVLTNFLIRKKSGL